MARDKTPKRETLPQLIDRRLAELGISSRLAASHAHGKISHSLLSRHRRGDGGKLSLQTAEGMALAIDVPLDVVLKAAEMPVSPGEFLLPPRAHLLTRRERDAVVSVIDAILASRGALPDDAGKRKKPSAS